MNLDWKKKILVKEQSGTCPINSPTHPGDPQPKTKEEEDKTKGWVPYTVEGPFRIFSDKLNRLLNQE